MKQSCFVCVAQIAKKVRLERRVRKEFLVDDLVRKARHGADVQPDRPGGDHEVSALKRSIAKRCIGYIFGIIFEQVAVDLRAGKEKVIPSRSPCHRQ